MGLRVIAIDTGEAKKSLALSLGAEKWIDFRVPLTGDLVDDVYAATNGLGAHAVLVTSGENAAYAVALKYLRSRGRLICVGLPPNGLVELSTTLVAARVSIRMIYSPHFMWISVLVASLYRLITF